MTINAWRASNVKNFDQYTELYDFAGVSVLSKYPLVWITSLIPIAPSFIAANAVIILKVDPGAVCCIVALLYIGVVLSDVIFA